MNMLISTEAAAWFKRELSLQNGAYVRLFPRYSSGAGCIPDSRWESLQNRRAVPLFSLSREA